MCWQVPTSSYLTEIYTLWLGILFQSFFWKSLITELTKQDKTTRQNPETKRVIMRWNVQAVYDCASGYRKPFIEAFVPVLADCFRITVIPLTCSSSSSSVRLVHSACARFESVRCLCAATWSGTAWTHAHLSDLTSCRSALSRIMYLLLSQSLFFITYSREAGKHNEASREKKKQSIISNRESI